MASLFDIANSVFKPTERGSLLPVRTSETLTLKGSSGVKQI